MFPILRGTFGLKAKEPEQPEQKPRQINYKQKAKARRALKLKKTQARHMRKVA